MIGLLHLLLGGRKRGTDVCRCGHFRAVHYHGPWGPVCDRFRARPRWSQ